MARINMKAIRELNEQDLRNKMQETRSELAKLRVDGSQGTLRKDSGKIKALRRDIARMMTRLNEVNRD